MGTEKRLRISFDVTREDVFPERSKSYIIKDFENFSHGKYSTKFVEQEFEKFKEFIKNVNVWRI